MSTPELSWGVCDEAMPTTISAIRGLLVALAESTLETRQMTVNRPFSRQNDFAAELAGCRLYEPATPYRGLTAGRSVDSPRCLRLLAAQDSMVVLACSSRSQATQEPDSLFGNGL